MPKYFLKNKSLRGFYYADSPEEAEFRFRRQAGRFLKTASIPRLRQHAARILAKNDFTVEEADYYGGMSNNEIEVLDGDDIK